MNHAGRYALTVVLFCLLMLGAVIGIFILVKMQVSHNNTQWCDTLKLLTSHAVSKPIDPKTNPSRLASYQLYLDFVSLKQRFGC